MPFAHVLLALLVVTIWGANFIFIKFSLDEFSPLFLCTLRFLLASVPAIFFIKPPKVPFRSIVMYGMVTFALQFIFLFVGMYLGVTAGMASLILQIQVFFSLFFAAVLLGDKPSVGQVVGAMVSFVGIGLVAFHLDQDIPFLGFLCILAAAAAWGLGNLITKKVCQVNMFSFVIWGCFVASIPLLILSLIFEGPASMVYSYQHMSWLGGASLFYTVVLSTLVGYGVWNWLVGKYPVAMVVPFTLLVPVVGILTSILVLKEPFQLWKLVAGLFVISGLYINLLSSRLFRTKTETAAALAE